MSPASPSPTPAQLMAVIHAQTEVARLGPDLAGVMTVVAERAQALTRAVGAVVELAEGDDMVYRAVAGTAGDQLGLRLPRSTSLSGRCVAEGTPLRCDDSDADPRVNREACRRVGLRSMVVVPLIHHGQPVGAVKVFAPRPGAFTEVDVTLLGLMTELIAAATYHAVKYGADELFRQATRDPLTGLANRALFYDRLRHGLVKAERECRRLGLLMIDMDGLKPINDAHGHPAGDAAIREIGRRLVGEARESDTVARLGGDEFGVVLSTVTDRHGAETAARRLAERCGHPFRYDDALLPVGASVGVAVYPDDGDRPDELVGVADQAMYAVKRERKRAGLAVAR